MNIRAVRKTPVSIAILAILVQLHAPNAWSNCEYVEGDGTFFHTTADYRFDEALPFYIFKIKPLGPYLFLDAIPEQGLPVPQFTNATEVTLSSAGTSCKLSSQDIKSIPNVKSEDPNANTLRLKNCLGDGNITEKYLFWSNSTKQFTSWNQVKNQAMTLNKMEQSNLINDLVRFQKEIHLSGDEGGGPLSMDIILSEKNIEFKSGIKFLSKNSLELYTFLFKIRRPLPISEFEQIESSNIVKTPIEIEIPIVMLQREKKMALLGHGRIGICTSYKNPNPTGDRLELPGFQFENAFSVSDGDNTDFITADKFTYQIDSDLKIHVF